MQNPHRTLTTYTKRQYPLEHGRDVDNRHSWCIYIRARKLPQQTDLIAL